MAFGIPTDTGGSGGGRDGAGGAGEGGGGTGSAPMRPTPPAPRDVRVIVNNVGNFTVNWRDYSQEDWPHDFPFSWFVRYCSQSLAGIPGERPDTPAPNFYSWVTDVLAKSRHIDSVSAAGRGAQLSITHDEPLPDGYVLVVGSNGPAVGPPSYPIFIRLTLNTDRIPDVGIVGPTQLTITKERVPRDVLRIDGEYGILLPPVLHEFGGVHPHVVDYNGISTPREVGPMAKWDGGTGLNTFTYRLPVEQGLGTGTAAFTHGSATVTWISGDAFAGAFAGRRIIADLDATHASATYVVNTSVHPTITLNAVFFDPNGVGGTYQWKVFSNSTWYFVPIGKSGVRVGDYTTAPSISL